VPLQSSCCVASARPPLHRSGPAYAKPNRSRASRVSASPGVLAPTNATTSGAPCFSPVRPESRPGGRGLPHPRRCRPQGSCPSRRFRPFRTRLARTLADPPFVRRGAPTLRGLVPCRSRPWNVPAELSLPEEPYPLSRACCFLAFRLPTAAGAAPPGPSRPLSLPEPTSLPPSPAGAEPVTHESGREFPATARRHLDAPAKARLGRRPLPVDAGLTGERPARPLRSFAPLGSPFARRPHALARARSPGRCSPGLLPL
jgi:hypothetical protein